MFAHVSEGVVVGLAEQPPERPIVTPRRTYDFVERERARRGLKPTAPSQDRLVDPDVPYEEWYDPWVPVPDGLLGEIMPGWRYDGETFTPPEPPAWTHDQLMAWVRRKREILLGETDALMAPDRPIPSERRAAIETYRQALRDLPEAIPPDVVKPDEVQFPTSPV